MLECPECGGEVPEVQGADVQVCPHCDARLPPEEELDEAPPPGGEREGEGFRARARTVLRRTLNLWWGNLATVLAYWFPAAAVTLGTRVAMERFHAAELARYEAEVANLLAGQPWDPEVLSSLGLVFLPYALLIGVVYAVFFAGAFGLAESYAWGEEVRAGRGFRVLAARLLPILGTVAVFWLAFTVGLVLLVVPALLAVHWLLPSLHAAAGGRGVSGALRESIQVMTRAGGLGFVLTVAGIWVGAEVASALAAALATALLGVSLDAPAVMAASAGVEWFLDPVLPLFVASYYLEARSLMVQAKRSQARGQGAVEGEGFRMHRCEECGTYGPAEGERFRCPSCGTEERLDGSGA